MCNKTSQSESGCPKTYFNLYLYSHKLAAFIFKLRHQKEFYHQNAANHHKKQKVKKGFAKIRLLSLRRWWSLRKYVFLSDIRYQIAIPSIKCVCRSTPVAPQGQDKVRFRLRYQKGKCISSRPSQEAACKLLREQLLSVTWQTCPTLLLGSDWRRNNQSEWTLSFVPFVGHL